MLASIVRRSGPPQAPLAGARPPKAQSRKGPSIWLLAAISAASFATFTFVVGRQVEAGDTGRNRTSSPLTPDTNMPIDEFYKPGERYPTLSERRELKAAQAAADDAPSAPSSNMPRLV